MLLFSFRTDKDFGSGEIDKLAIYAQITYINETHCIYVTTNYNIEILIVIYSLVRKSNLKIIKTK